MQRGFCKHPDKKCRIVVPWKCVDIIFPSDITREEQTRRRGECQKVDHCGVCEMCRYFTADAPAAQPPQTAAPATPAAKPKKESAHTENADIEF